MKPFNHFKTMNSLPLQLKINRNIIKLMPFKEDDSVFNDFENLKELPNSQGLYTNIKWVNLSNLENLYIFPQEVKPENFNQGNTGLSFFLMFGFDSWSSRTYSPIIWKSLLLERKKRIFCIFIL